MSFTGCYTEDRPLFHSISLENPMNIKVLCLTGEGGLMFTPDLDAGIDRFVIHSFECSGKNIDR